MRQFLLYDISTLSALRTNIIRKQIFRGKYIYVFFYEGAVNIFLYRYFSAYFYILFPSHTEQESSWHLCTCSHALWYVLFFTCPLRTQIRIEFNFQQNIFLLSFQWNAIIIIFVNFRHFPHMHTNTQYENLTLFEFH